MMTQQQDNTSAWTRSVYPWLIVCCGMLFYCFNYFLRSSPGVLQDQISSAFHINATGFGALAGLYYWAYTPMQLPAGMMYDKFGVRSVLSIAVFTAALGLLVFINADQYYMAGFGRFMIGACCAFAYIGTLKLAAMWLPANRFAFVAGLTTAVGMSAGAIYEQYLEQISKTVPYQQALYPIVLVGIALCVLMAILVRNRSTATGDARNYLQNPMDTRHLLQELKLMVTSKQMWLIGLVG